MAQILWIGCLESDEEFKIKAMKGYDLASAQVSQKNLLSGIENVSGLVFDSINGSVLPPFPIYKDRVIEPVIWEHVTGAYNVSVGYNNDKYINRINCKKAMIRAADEWCAKRYTGEELIVFVYSMRSAPMATACYIKNKIKKAKIYLIITDLPQFMDLGQSRIKAFLKSIDWKYIKKMQKEFNGFILYAERMASFLKLSKDEWMLMEGSYDSSEQDIIVKEKKKAIMYSGKLDEQYGIRLLVEAFMQIDDPELELWLTGGGNAVEYIKLCAQRDRRIKFYGFLPSRKAVIEMQKQATLLVNMRLPSEKASEYCFPSKLFEYMVTGIPVLSFRIKGIPEEYEKYLYFIEHENEVSVKETIKYALSLSKEARDEVGEKAREFILKHKNSSIQSKKIWEYVNEK